MVHSICHTKLLLLATECNADFQFTHLLEERQCHIILVYIPQQRLDLFQAQVAHMLQQNRMQLPLQCQWVLRSTSLRYASGSVLLQDRVFTDATTAVRLSHRHVYMTWRC